MRHKILASGSGTLSGQKRISRMEHFCLLKFFFLQPLKVTKIGIDNIIKGIMSGLGNDAIYLHLTILPSLHMVSYSISPLLRLIAYVSLSMICWTFNTSASTNCFLPQSGCKLRQNMVFLYSYFYP